MMTYDTFKSNLKAYNEKQSLLADNMRDYAAPQAHDHGNLVPLSEMYRAIGKAMQKALLAYCKAVWPSIKHDGEQFTGTGIKHAAYDLPNNGNFWDWSKPKAEPKTPDISKAMQRICKDAIAQHLGQLKLVEMLETAYEAAYSEHAKKEAKRLAHEAELLAPVKQAHAAYAATMQEKLDELQRRLDAAELARAAAEQHAKAEPKANGNCKPRKDKNGELRPTP